MHSSESTITTLPYPPSLLDSSTSSIIFDQAKFYYIIRIIFELEDENNISQLI